MQQFQIWAPIVMSVLAIVIIPLAIYSLKASLKISQAETIDEIKGWFDKFEDNMERKNKELFSDKVNQAEVDKDLEHMNKELARMQTDIDMSGDIKAIKKMVKKLGG